LQQALDSTIVAGPKTNIAFLSNLCDNKGFRAEKFDTSLIDENLKELAAPSETDSSLEAAGIVALITKEQARIAAQGDAASPWAVNDGFCGAEYRDQDYKYLLDGEISEARLRFSSKGIDVLDSDGMVIKPAAGATSVDAGTHVFVLKYGRQLKLESYVASSAALDGSGGDGVVRVPMHGKIIAVSVADGDQVEVGDLLFAVEAMKMEHAVIAPVAGVISECAVAIGAQMEDGAVGLKIDMGDLEE
jgi:3-methylcrotonyl-CoA carboxylase alpha subunit